MLLSHLKMKDQRGRLLDTTPGYVICGKGPTAVLLHSSMSSKDQWKSLMSLLENRFKLIAIDLAGYGDNDLPLHPQDFSTWDEVCLVEGILAKETRNNEGLHLVGHSYGGAVTLKLAEKILNRVKTMTLFEPVAFHLLKPKGSAHNEITDIVRKLTRALSEGDKTFATQLFIDYWSGNGTFEKLSHRNKEMFIKYIDKVLLDFKALFNESLTLDDYAKINVSTCMIKGEKSPLSSLQIFQALEHTLPDICVHSVAGGHMSPITHFKKVNGIIERFLTSQEFV